MYLHSEMQWLVCANSADVNLAVTVWQLKHVIQSWHQQQASVIQWYTDATGTGNCCVTSDWKLNKIILQILIWKKWCITKCWSGITVEEALRDVPCQITVYINTVHTVPK